MGFSQKTMRKTMALPHGTFSSENGTFQSQKNTENRVLA